MRHMSAQLVRHAVLQVVNVLGFSLPFYRSPTLLLSLGLSVRVLYYLITQRPDVIHVSSPGLLVFAATLYAKLLAIPLVVSFQREHRSAPRLSIQTLITSREWRNAHSLLLLMG